MGATLPPPYHTPNSQCWRIPLEIEAACSDGNHSEHGLDVKEWATTFTHTVSKQVRRLYLAVKI
jgi:hypothetical protein